VLESGVWVLCWGEAVNSGKVLFHRDGEREFGDGTGVCWCDFDAAGGVLHVRGEEGVDLGGDVGC